MAAGTAAQQSLGVVPSSCGWGKKKSSHILFQCAKNVSPNHPTKAHHRVSAGRCRRTMQSTSQEADERQLGTSSIRGAQLPSTSKLNKRKKGNTENDVLASVRTLERKVATQSQRTALESEGRASLWTKQWTRKRGMHRKEGRASSGRTFD